MENSKLCIIFQQGKAYKALAADGTMCKKIINGGICC